MNYMAMTMTRGGDVGTLCKVVGSILMFVGGLLLLVGWLLSGGWK